MIQPIQIKFRSESEREIIEIASGPYLGHECDVMRLMPSGVYMVGGHEYCGLDAALHAAVARAYLYVAQQESEKSA